MPPIVMMRVRFHGLLPLRIESMSNSVFDAPTGLMEQERRLKTGSGYLKELFAQTRSTLYTTVEDNRLLIKGSKAAIFERTHYCCLLLML